MDLTKAKRFTFSLMEIEEPAAVLARYKANVLIRVTLEREGP